jgi:biotin operon repressor
MIIEITGYKKNQSTTGKKLDNVLDYLLTNKDKWVKSDVIIDETGVKSIRLYINKLRNVGHPIISDVKMGYKLTSNEKEISDCYKKLRLRALRALTSAKLMKKNMK